jgi:hypothetical protein
MKTIVGVPNKVDVLMDHRAIDTHMARFSTLFTRHTSVNHFEVIEAQIFKFLHEKINLGGEHVHLFKMVNLVGAGLSALINPALTKAIFSINARASLILRAKNEPPAAPSICSLAE